MRCWLNPVMTGSYVDDDDPEEVNLEKSVCRVENQEDDGCGSGAISH